VVADAQTFAPVPHEVHETTELTVAEKYPIATQVNGADAVQVAAPAVQALHTPLVGP